VEVQKMPEFDLSNFDAEKAAAEFGRAVKDAAYVAVGLGIMGFQRAQVQRVELTKQLESQLGGVSGLTSVLNGLADLREQLVKLSADVLPSDSRLDGTAVRTQLTELAKAVDEAVAPVRQQFEEQWERFEELLPESARELVHAVREAAAAQEQAVRSAVGLSDPLP
jgi:hypothetical protein